MAAKKKTSKKPAIDKAAKFVELARKRMTKALKSIASLRNLANRNNYEYTDAQVTAMLTALKKEVVALEAAFKTKDKTANGGFDFE